MSYSQYPRKWNSVCRPITYEFDYIQFTATTYTNVAGKIEFSFSDGGGWTWGVNAPISRRVYISDGVYAGWHNVTLLSVSGGQARILTSTNYISTDSARVGKYITDVTFAVIVGYVSGAGAAFNPERIIAGIQPQPNLQGRLIFDISGYLKSAWSDDGFSPSIAPPANGIDWNMSTPFRLASFGFNPDGGITYYAANAVIDSFDLTNFDTSGEILSDVDPIVFTCGCTILSQIDTTENAIRNTIVCGGAITVDNTKQFQDSILFQFQDGTYYDFN